jgi:hypothetical protein
VATPIKPQKLLLLLGVLFVFLLILGSLLLLSAGICLDFFFGGRSLVLLGLDPPTRFGGGGFLTIL